MYEGKSLSAALLGDEVKMEIDLSVRHTEVKGESMGIKSMDLGGSGMLHIGLGNSSSGGGSGGEDSSSDEPAVHHHNRTPRHRLPPKKYRLKECSEQAASRVSSAFASFRNNNDDEEEGKDDDDGGNMEDLNPEDDDCSGISHKDARMQHSFTSGENSDSEMGGYGDGDDSSKQDGDDAGKKLFECDVCNMKFSNGANMRRHRMRHTGVKPFECRICQKRKDHLAEHMATHSKLLPFRCPICNKGFQRQIAMRAHFQNEHVGGSHDIVKACPLCTYKSGSMKSLRVHFYSRHGIDLDNPLPHSPSFQPSTNGVSPASPGLGASSGNGEYSELAHALGFEDREKSSDSSLIPSHFLVPQIEISSNSPYPSHYPFTADSSYDLHDSRHHSNHDDSSSSPTNVSPKSDSSSNAPSSSDLVVIKTEILEVEQGSPEQSTSTGSSADEAKPKSSVGDSEDIQEGPEDLSSAGQSKSSFRSKLNSSSSLVKISPLKSLLREDWKKDGSICSRLIGATNNSNGSPGKSSSNGRNSINGGAGHANPPSGYQVSEGDAISSSETSMTSHSLQNRRDQAYPNSIHQCIYCKIVFPDITLYFLHKGCHTDSSPWRCNICGETCCNVYDFNSHLLSKSHQ